MKNSGSLCRGSFDEGKAINRLSAWVCLGALVLVGCERQKPKAEATPVPTVTVSRPVARDVTYSVDFTGRTAAPYAVEVRPRVTGYLIRMPFKEGAEVKANDVLFEIDPRPYQAQLDRAQGEVILGEARLKLAIADNARAQNIASLNAGAISKQDLDKYAAAEAEAAAALEATKASLEGYKINLEFTKVLAPIDGRVNRYNYTIGNLVNADMTTLTTIVSQDPMYVYFDVDEQTLLRVLRRMLDRQDEPVKDKAFPVMMAVGDEDGFPHAGHVNFIDNVVSSSTGTLTVRGTFPNPATEFVSPAAEAQVRLMRPGMFVRVRLPLGKPRASLLVSERALGTDQGRKYVLVVDDQKIVKYVPVTVGPLQDDGLRVIESGLQAEDKVIVSGLQLVRPKAEVNYEEVPMVGSRQAHQESGATESKPVTETPK